MREWQRLHMSLKEQKKILLKALDARQVKRFKIIENHITDNLICYAPDAYNLAKEVLYFSSMAVLKINFHYLKWYQCRFKRQQFVEIRGLKS